MYPLKAHVGVCCKDPFGMSLKIQNGLQSSPSSLLNFNYATHSGILHDVIQVWQRLPDQDSFRTRSG